MTYSECLEIFTAVLLGNYFVVVCSTVGVILSLKILKDKSCVVSTSHAPYTQTVVLDCIGSSTVSIQYSDSWMCD